MPLSAAVPLLSFSTSPVLVWSGAIVWGASLGIHESTQRAAVADLIPPARRGTAYGLFTTAYGIAWLAGSTLIGILYDHSITAVVIFTVTTQIAALALFLPLLAGHAGAHRDARR